MNHRQQESPVTINTKGRGLRLTLALALIATSLVTASPTSAVTGAKQMLVVLCNFQNQQHGIEGYDRDYYRDMFSSQGAGELGSYDYWRAVSYGQLTLDATVVGWYTIPTQRDAWAANDRNTRWRICVEQAANDVHYEAFVGAVVVIPDVMARTVSAVKAADTTITVMDDPSRFPATPFNAHFINGETIRVTARFGNDLVVQRGYAGTTPADYDAGSWVQADGADLFGGEPAEVELAGNKFTLGRAFMPHDISLAGAANETGHLLGLIHSTAASTLPSEYNDCYDIMSTYSGCSYLFDEGNKFGGTIYTGYSQYGKGPGLNAVQVDAMGWLPADRKATFDNSSCRQQTYSMAALNRPDRSGIHQLRVPFGFLPFQYVAAELHDKSGWYRGIPASAFTLHAKLSDGRSMLIDSLGDGSMIGDGTTGIGGLVAGKEYVNTILGMYVGVNSVGDGTGQLTMGSCKLDAGLEYVGATRGQYSDSTALAARLTVEGTSAPIPGANVRLGIGTNACFAKTDTTGLAQCSIVLNQQPGDDTVGASFAGTPAYQATSDSATFTVEKEVTTLTHAGALTGDYHDAFVTFGQLTDDDGASVVGRSVSFTLGADGCTATTNSGGVATCSITPTQPAATYSLSTAFNGDALYEPSSDTDSFEVTHEESTTTITGPNVILAGTGSTATLEARFVEDGANGDGTDRTAVPAGQTISFSLGGESCAATTDASGVAQCTVNVPASPALGPQPITATFAGDAYYEPSSGTKDAIVFAFPSTGAFLLGDNTVATATPTTKVTWWSDAWWSLNSLSGGTAPDSFKGLAAEVSQLPTTNPANSCGSSFRSPPGNSPPPAPSAVPTYMGVIVASSAVKSKKGISGTWARIVVVKTDGGYSPNPGFPGTGTIVATFCP